MIGCDGRFAHVVSFIDPCELVSACRRSKAFAVYLNTDHLGDSFSSLDVHVVYFFIWLCTVKVMWRTRQSRALTRFFLLVCLFAAISTESETDNDSPYDEVSSSDWESDTEVVAYSPGLGDADRQKDPSPIRTQFVVNNTRDLVFLFQGFYTLEETVGICDRVHGKLATWQWLQQVENQERLSALYPPLALTATNDKYEDIVCNFFTFNLTVDRRADEFLGCFTICLVEDPIALMKFDNLFGLPVYVRPMRIVEDNPAAFSNQMRCSLPEFSWIDGSRNELFVGTAGTDPLWLRLPNGSYGCYSVKEGKFVDEHTSRICFAVCAGSQPNPAAELDPADHMLFVGLQLLVGVSMIGAFGVTFGLWLRRPNEPASEVTTALRSRIRAILAKWALAEWLPLSVLLLGWMLAVAKFEVEGSWLGWLFNLLLTVRAWVYLAQVCVARFACNTDKSGTIEDIVVLSGVGLGVILPTIALCLGFYGPSIYSDVFGLFWLKSARLSSVAYIVSFVFLTFMGPSLAMLFLAALPASQPCGIRVRAMQRKFYLTHFASQMIIATFVGLPAVLSMAGSSAAHSVVLGVVQVMFIAKPSKLF